MAVPQQQTNQPHQSSAQPLQNQNNTTGATAQHTTALIHSEPSMPTARDILRPEVAGQSVTELTTSDAISPEDVSRRHASQPPTRRRSRSADVRLDPLPRTALNDPVSDVNNANPWKAWLQKSSLPPQLATATGGADTDQIEEDLTSQHVRNILASTAHQLTSGNAKPGIYPHKLVFRGPEKKRIPLNNVSLAEHLWGILCIVKDPKVDPRIKPCLLAHLEDVIEDACDFQWPAVRRWSEETFSLIAENRIPNGWYAVNRIQLLRVSMSRIDNAKLTFDVDFPAQSKQQSHNPSAQSKQQSFNQQTDGLRGGPPCQAFNSQAGCNQQSGHMIGGRRMLHICSYCLMQCSTGYQHSEASCRNKLKFGKTHF